mgnify:CR=1 FL=1
MKPGDLIRFRQVESDPWKQGLLLDYVPWMKIATVLYKGDKIRVAAWETQIVQRSPENLKNKA